MIVLDTTIRDGSYAINFNFSCVDVEVICKKLESLGIQMIEIGHGMGLSASSPKNGISLHSDEEYFRAARMVVKKPLLGVFCIPGIATFDSIYMAKESGLDFIRVGINADRVDESEEYIKLSKKLGFTVMTNYMKSYAITPEVFAKNVKKSEYYGADYVYIVDSAGSMLPKDIDSYYEAVRRVSDIRLGFHGHDNLGLAVSNSLHCLELGFEIIDTSLQGLGRSSGNASTELFFASAIKSGAYLDTDIIELFNAGYDTLRPLVKNRLRNPLDMMCGFAEFHTSYMKYIHKCSALYKVDALALIYEYCKYDKLNMNYDLLCKTAKALPRHREWRQYNFSDYIGDEQTERTSNLWL